MWPIWAQRCSQLKGMAEARGITARNGSWPEMDHSQRRIAANDGWYEMGSGQRWIAAWYGSWLDNDWWQEVDNQRWVTGDGSQEMDANQCSFQYADIEVLQSYTLLEITYLWFQARKEQSRAVMQIHEALPLVCFQWVWYQPVCRTLVRLGIKDGILYIYMFEFQCQYRTSSSHKILVSGWETIINKWNDCGGMTITTTVNYRTGSARTKPSEMHAPIGNSSSSKCTWRRNINCTPRTVKVHPGNCQQSPLQITLNVATTCTCFECDPN